MIILGIDPGTAITGYGVIKTVENKKLKNKRRFKCLGYSSIKTSASFSAQERLKIINNKLSKIIKEFRPDVLAMEKLFFFKNFKTIIPVSQAGGVILMTAAKKKLPVYQFTPLQVKLIIAGYGRAEKKQVQKKIKRILGLKEIPRPDDAADALAVAVCCAKEIEKNGLDT